MSNYVKLMADYCASGVWNREGVNVDIDSIPLPYWLKQMITDWVALYDRESFDDKNFDYAKFSKDGYALAVKMKQNLPADWEVFYFDEVKARDLGRTGFDNYLYEIFL